MATIKAIEARSVHRIQSGQVIVDLCSVVKELVENSLDAQASIVEVRFKNNGLDVIEVQDNGTGISPENYDSLALKHHTSKLSTYDDLSRLDTFGFRGEALSSLCALSSLYVVTARADEAPKGARLDFETSGKLKKVSVTASQKGTTVFVEGLFQQLPVRRKELTKNIKREYQKVIGLLHAYACICTNVKFIVKNTMPKGKALVVFSTNANATTRENIANVYGTRTLGALVPLDLDLELASSVARKPTDPSGTMVKVRGHISRPIFGEGRQTPDRQMFFVNGRPCGLPQISKAINEVYKSFNVSQSPFIFADFQMDTNAYDVNVSPDKRTILLHNAAVMIEKLKDALTEMFENQDQTVPQSHVQTSKIPSFKPINIRELSESGRKSSTESEELHTPESQRVSGTEEDSQEKRSRLFHEHFRVQASTREEPEESPEQNKAETTEKRRKQLVDSLAGRLAGRLGKDSEEDDSDYAHEPQRLGSVSDGEVSQPFQVQVRDFNKRMDEQTKRSPQSHHKATSPSGEDVEEMHPSSQGELPNIVQNAFDRMRPRRPKADIATITIGDKTITTPIGSQAWRGRATEIEPHTPGHAPRAQTPKSALTQKFSQGLRKFDAAVGDRVDEEIPEAGESDDESLSTSGNADTDEETREEQQEMDEELQSRLLAEAEQSHTSDSYSETDSDYIDEDEKKANEEAKVAELIQAAEQSTSMPSEHSLKRANNALKSAGARNSTKKLSTTVEVDISTLRPLARSLRELEVSAPSASATTGEADLTQSEEQRLSLIVSKEDFANMRVVGQFNLGFILAVRHAALSSTGHDTSANDELFIIDQHASDEKYNFERLQHETIISHQRLVHPATLQLTAVQEEIIIDNPETLSKNGFLVSIDRTGQSPVGQRVNLLSLPLSREVTFSLPDLEELIHLLAEWPSTMSSSTDAAGGGGAIPRPGKIRKLLAMRACRSSIMIGTSLSNTQMQTVLRHMGTIDKPWNCPHGRPTMRHLIRLNGVDRWREGMGDGDERERQRRWREYVEES